MDFGEILDDWDKMTAKAAGKRALKKETQQPESPAVVEQRPVDPLTAWLRVNGTVDKDALARDESETPPERRRRLTNKKPDAVLDLHGLTRDEAWGRLQAFFGDARRMGAEKVLVVHGKGNHSEGESVLKRTVREFIERSPLAGEHGHAPATHGGTGATWVLLKKGR